MAPRTPLLQSTPIGLAAVAIAISLTTAIYVIDLEHTPVYFGGDEAHFAVHGHSLATTGRDLNGTRLPLFVNLNDPQGDLELQKMFPAWYQPFLFYAIALTLEVLPLNEVSVRLPTALIGGLLSPLLMYIVARRLLNDRRAAMTAMLILVLSPPLLILSRQALDYVCPIPFVLGWLWCLLAFLEHGGPWRAFLGGLMLGVGFYSYIASWVFMPVCLALTWITCVRARSDGLRGSIFASLGFLVPLGLLIPWAWFHPEMFRQTAGRYLIRAEGASLMQGVGNLVGLDGVRQLVSTYVGYLDPIFLFVRGGVSMTTSTTRSGVLLVAVAPLLVAGAYELARQVRRQPVAIVLLAGLLLAPLPAALVNERRMIQREIFMLPFAAAIAGFGAARLMSHARASVRAVTAALIVAMPLQFAYVYRDYFGHYKLRSAFYYDPVVFGDVADTIVAADPPAILLSRDLDDAGPKWRFFATKLGRQDLLARTTYVDANTIMTTAATPGSLLVILPDTATLDGLANTGRWTIVRSIEDIDHRPASVVLRRTR